jgi:hypothetical protein
MDDRMVGLVGGIGGGVIGVIGGLIGTYISIKNTHGPKERAFITRAAVLCWLAVAAFVAAALLLPSIWRIALLIGYPFAFVWFCRWTNAGQARCRVDDLSQCEPPGG